MMAWAFLGLLGAILAALLWIGLELAVIRSAAAGLLRLGATRFKFADEVAGQHLAPIQASIDRLARTIAGRAP